MDDTKCPPIYFFHLLSENKADSSLGKYTGGKQRQSSLHEKGCRGDIAYIQNPLFERITPKSFKENTNSCKAALTNGGQNLGSRNDCYDKLLFPKLNSQNPKSQERTGVRISSKPKSRRDRMKERAETRRCELIDESSDEDFSSTNSFSHSHSTSNKYSTNMDDAHNKRSRSARTERYMRRLSKEDGFHNGEVGAAGRLQGTDAPWGERQAQAFHHPAVKNMRERNSSAYFFNQNDTVLNNPIYSVSSTGSPTFYYNSKPTINHKEFVGYKVSERNVDYNKTHRSDPGRDAILAYKNIKSPSGFDRVHYVEPKAFNYQHQQPGQISAQNTMPADSSRRVRRSQSFQSEIPKDYESRNNIWPTMHRVPRTEAAKTTSSCSGNERKWTDSFALPVSTTARSSGRSMADFLQRRSYPARDRSELAIGKTDLKKTSESSLTKYDRDSTNLMLSTINKEKTPIKKRNSKDLGRELSELEKMYSSLRLSDDNLLERAEERCIEEFSHKSQSPNELATHLSSGSSSESINLEDRPTERHLQQELNEAKHVIHDDMAYRKMQSKKMPALSETQNSLSQISYLLASSAMILDKTDYLNDTEKLAKEEPNITRDDMVYRNLHYVNNVLKVADPQPPFGIPLRPATPSTNSNYLCSSPVTVKSPPLKFVPQSEPNLVTDDLAFRNLRKDTPKTPPSALPVDNKDESNIFVFKTESEKPVSEDQFIRKKKKAVRSLSANLYGLINEVNSLGLNIT